MLKYIIGLVAFLAVLGFVGHKDVEVAQLEKASLVCRYQTANTIPTFDQCMANQFETNNDK